VAGETEAVVDRERGRNGHDGRGTVGNRYALSGEGGGPAVAVEIEGGAGVERRRERIDCVGMAEGEGAVDGDGAGVSFGRIEEHATAGDREETVARDLA